MSPEKTVGTQQKTKELKIFSTQIITLDQIKKDKRKLLLLNIIKNYNEVSEKGLAYLITLLKDEKGFNINYTTVKLGNRAIVRELQDDIKALLYTGLVEVNPKNKKLRLTSNGQEFLESTSKEVESFNDVLQAAEELKTRVQLVDEEVSLIATGRR
ncbi:MAG: hypothetical protein QW101_05520 [Ignisphaera sp.]|uniref:Uncharacterized protein n=1 Tax=Ignisphaera aggregans TaxID=334771 RepID=A0A7J3MXE2_9CREN